MEKTMENRRRKDEKRMKKGPRPRGKRPAWLGRPSTDPEPPKPAGPKTYPDLKKHFETLDLARN